MKLKDYLKEKGMSGTTFAAKSGLSYPKVMNIIKGRMPTLITALKIKNFTNGEVRLEDMIPEGRDF